MTQPGRALPAGKDRMTARLGLALGGGGARGLAHIGALKVLETEGIRVDALAGTSMGGLVAAAFAAGIPLSEIEERALALARPRELVKLLDVSRARRGLMDGSRVRRFLSSLFGGLTFDDARLPLALVAVDLLTGCLVPIRRGLLLPAVLATTAVPGLFPPQDIGPMRLVDGGVLCNVPAALARELAVEAHPGDAPVVLALDPQLDPAREEPWQDLSFHPDWPISLPEFFMDLYRAELLMIAESTRVHLEKARPELVVRPAIPPDVDMFLGFPHAADIIRAGEDSMREALPALRDALAKAEATKNTPA